MANTIVTGGINDGHSKTLLEVNVLIAIMPVIANSPIELFGKNSMVLFGDKPCFEGKTGHQSMVMHAALSVLKDVLEGKGLDMSGSIGDIAMGIEVTRKDVVAKKLNEVRERIKGKSASEMAELAKNDEGGCAGGACKL
tara:strand:- start:6627 stop:7043 length:417 start_codon:yes stop_codon:yes gene_type:complete